VGGWALEGRRHGQTRLGFEGFVYFDCFGRFMGGGICASRGCSLWWVVARLFFYIAPTLGTSHRRIATVGSRSRCTSVARLVGGLPNPHPQVWAGLCSRIESSPSLRPREPGVVCLGTHYFRFHFILLTRLNKALTWLFRSLTLYSLPFPE
jgi:hypothetical protein